MIDIESLLDKAQELKGRENGIRWELAEIADQIVGSPLGRAGATKQLAQVCGLSAVDAVEHWAKAYDLYNRILHISAHTAHKFRDEFSVSHFYAMSDLENKYNLNMTKVISYFREMLTYKETGESWSVASLMEEVDAHEKKKKTAVNWRWHWTRLEKHMQELLTFDGELPPVVRSIARMYLGVKERIK